MALELLCCIGKIKGARPVHPIKGTKHAEPEEAPESVLTGLWGRASETLFGIAAEEKIKDVQSHESSPLKVVDADEAKHVEGKAPSAGTPTSPARKSREQAELADVKDLDALALRMKRWIRKYPKKKSALWQPRPRERYMAVVPMCQTEHDGLSAHQRWQRGFLAYWENKDDFLADLEPRGCVPLLHIAKVRHNEHDHDGCGVLVKHVEEGEAKEMVILFPSMAEAREFGYILWEFLAKLRGQWSQQCPTSIRAMGA